MKKQKYILIVSIFLIGIFCFMLFYINNNAENEEEKIESFNKIELEQSKFQVHKDDDNIIELIYNGKDIEQFMTVISSKKPADITIKINENDYSDDVYIINKSSGEEIYLEKTDEETLNATIDFLPDIDYGIIIDKRLVGAIRAVENINEIDTDIIKMDMFLNIKCGL